jgi:hypothetical protein
MNELEAQSFPRLPIRGLFKITRFLERASPHMFMALKRGSHSKKTKENRHS